MGRLAARILRTLTPGPRCEAVGDYGAGPSNLRRIRLADFGEVRSVDIFSGDGGLFAKRKRRHSLKVRLGDVERVDRGLFDQGAVATDPQQAVMRVRLICHYPPALSDIVSAVEFDMPPRLESREDGLGGG